MDSEVKHRTALAITEPRTILELVGDVSRRHGRTVRRLLMEAVQMQAPWLASLQHLLQCLIKIRRPVFFVTPCQHPVLVHAAMQPSR
jgi:hypothetical protein